MTLEDQIYNTILENNGKLDLIGIALKFPGLPMSIFAKKMGQLEEAGKIESRAVCGSQYVYFVRE